MTGDRFDIAVVGAGVVGLAHAYVAARRGLSVAVIDRDVRANGASIRNFGFITVTGQERGDAWRLARRTRDVWAEVAAAAGIAVEHNGLYLTLRSAEAVAVADAFLATEMGEGCRLIVADDFRAACHGLGGPDLQGALHSPHEVRVESKTAIPGLARYLEDALGVAFFRETAVRDIALPCIRTARGEIVADAAVVCPGDDFASLYPERIARYRLRRCRLSMLRLADPGFRLPGGLMSDLSLIRYAGYAALPQAAALKEKLLAEQPRHIENGVHLIVVQSADGSLVVGDSHHYDDLPAPFAPASAEADILDEFRRATGRAAPAVLERWTGTYTVADDRTFFIETPEPGVRLVMVTTGAGASLSFGLAERTLDDLLGSKDAAA
jgi:FAD dependent oxidoreductase TIGR03364